MRNRRVSVGELRLTDPGVTGYARWKETITSHVIALPAAEL